MTKTINGGRGLKRALASGEKTVVLFYASWCPFSRVFLPVYERFAEDRAGRFLRMLVDNAPDVCEAYGVEVYPTVLFFDQGKLVRRLDGTAGRGLDERRLSEFVGICLGSAG